MKIAASVLIEELKKSQVIAITELAKYVEEKKMSMTAAKIQWLWK